MRAASNKFKNPQQKRRMKNLLTFLFVFIIIISVIILLFSRGRNGAGKLIEIGQDSTAGNYRQIEEEGKTYEYNNRLTTILYVGIDSEGAIAPSKSYGTAPRCDTLMLLVLDEYQKSFSIISINRNTIAPVQQYDLMGNPLSKAEKQIAYAFAEGEGGTVSCSNVKRAVSDLLGGIPIDYYVVMNRSAIPYINGLAGGVTVTVPNDDLSGLDSELSAGNVVTLTDEQAELFIHYRDIEQDYTNAGRMERQKAYVLAYIETLQNSLSEDIEGTWAAWNDGVMSDYVLTSITRNQYIGLADILKSLDLSNPNFYIPEGEDDNSEELEKYYINQEALSKAVLEIFYLEQ